EGCVEQAPVHGLEAVTHLGQRTAHDHAHRVIDVAALHLLPEIDGFDAVAFAAGGRKGGVSHDVFFLRSLRESCDWRDQTSRKRTSFALRAMKLRRAETSSPIRMEKSSSAAAASSRVTCRSTRTTGSIVVSHSSLAFISPRPL